MRTREEIKSQMVHYVAELWDVDETEAFDPLVDLLIGACATEFEKIGQELSNSRQRILDRVVSTLTPDAFNGAVPSHAVLCADALDPLFVIKPTDSFYAQVKTGKTDTEVHFVPTDFYDLMDGKVTYLAFGSKIVHTKEKKAIVDVKSKAMPSDTLWVGLSLKELPISDKITYYFNWKNESRLDFLLAQLPFTTWSLNKMPLSIEAGLQTKNQDIEISFGKEFSVSNQIIEKVRNRYEGHFMTINIPKTGLDLENLKTIYPDEWVDVFPVPELNKALKEKLLWFKIVFPTHFTSDVMNRLECSVNCFPVLNRKYNQESYNVQDSINIVPMRCEEYFFEIQEVTDSKGGVYQSTPLANLKSRQPNFYTLRDKGVGKLDDRVASQVLRQTIELLRDESAAFSAYSYEFLQAKLKSLTQEINDLEEQINSKGKKQDEQPYLYVSTRKKEKIEIKYWSTNGEIGNGVPAGTKLDMFKSFGVKPDSVVLMTSSTGGRNRLMASESFFEYKKALLSRDRIVTHEDIKTYCFAQLQNKLRQVTIKNGLAISDIPNQGLMRAIDVVLQSNEPNISEQEWMTICKDIEKDLNRKSTGILPIRVSMSFNQNS